MLAARAIVRTTIALAETIDNTISGPGAFRSPDLRLCQKTVPNLDVNSRCLHFSMDNSHLFLIHYCSVANAKRRSASSTYVNSCVAL